MSYDYATPSSAGQTGMEPRAQVLGSLAEVFGRYSRPTDYDDEQDRHRGDDENEEEGEYQGDISDAAHLERVWSHARQELKEKERELSSSLSRSLAEASLARTGTVLKEALANQLAEERDRARFLELSLAESVSNMEALKVQHQDCLTRLGEALKACEEKAALVSRLSSALSDLQTSLANVMNQRDQAYREREAVITRSIEAMALAEKQQRERTADCEGLERTLERQRATIQEGQLKQASLAATVASLTAQLDAERARAVEMGETLLRQRTLLEKTEEDRATFGLLTRQAEQARLDAGRLVRMLAETPQYRLFAAAAFLESGVGDRPNGQDGDEQQLTEASHFVAAPLPSVVKADQASAALAAARARDLARMQREYPLPLAQTLPLTAAMPHFQPGTIPVPTATTTGAAGRTGLMPLPSSSSASKAAAGTVTAKPHPFATPVVPGLASTVKGKTTRSIPGLSVGKKAIGAPKLGRAPPPPPPASEQELARWVPHEVAAAAGAWRDAVASRQLSAAVVQRQQKLEQQQQQQQQQNSASSSSSATHGPRAIVDASGALHQFSTMQQSGISPFSLASFGPSLEEMRALLLHLNGLWATRTHAAMLALKAHHNAHVKKLLAKVNFNQPYREVLQSATIARLTNEVRRLKQERMLGELEDQNAAFLQQQPYEAGGGEGGGGGGREGGVDDPWALPFTGFEETTEAATGGAVSFADVSAPPASYLAPSFIRGYHAVPVQGTGITSRATIAREREAVGEKVHRDHQFVVETPAPTTFGTSHRNAGGVFNPPSSASKRGRGHSPSGGSVGSASRRNNSRAASPAPLTSYRLDEQGNLITPAAAAAADGGPTSLLCVPGSGGQRLDPHETGVLLEEALATVDFLRSRVESLTEERDSLRTALHQTNARRQAVGEMVVANAAAASAAEQATLVSSSFLSGVTKEVLHHCSMALNVLESTCSGHLTSALQSADDAVSSLTNMASLAVALRYKPSAPPAGTLGLDGSHQQQQQEEDDSHERAVRQLLPLIEGIASSLGNVSENARKCARGHVEVRARLNSALAMPSLANTPGAATSIGNGGNGEEHLHQHQQAQQQAQAPSGPSSLRSNALSTREYRAAVSSKNIGAVQPPPIPAPSSAGASGQNPVFNLMRTPSASAASFIGGAGSNSSYSNSSASSSGGSGGALSAPTSPGAAAALAAAERLKQQVQQHQAQSQSQSQAQSQSSYQRATSPSPLARAQTPPPLHALPIQEPSTTAASAASANTSGTTPQQQAVIAQALQVAALRRASGSSSSSLGIVPQSPLPTASTAAAAAAVAGTGSGVAVTFAPSPSIALVDMAAPPSSSSTPSSS